MMSTLVLLVALLVLLLLLGVIYILKNYAHSDEKGVELGKSGFTVEGFAYFLIVLAVLYVVGLGYFYVRGTALEGHLLEWMNIVVRLMHITFGIAWIGASFYFVFLENALNRTDNVREELAGNLWAVHGGGFYYLEKYKVAPKEIPKALHWFKYEAYFTWLSGFSLLFVVYYFNAKAMLVDASVLDISSLTAIALGIGSLAAAWIIYDQLCKTALVKRGIWFAIIGFIIATAFAFFYCQVFSSRAAYIHFGAMLGTLMAANVFFVIIPAQKAMVQAAKEGRPVDPTLGKNALFRSLHNNYFTLPVLFVMVSSHFPSTFGHQYPWLILMGISLGTAGIKHWLNLREKKQATGLVMPAAVVLLLGVAFYSAPKTEATGTATCKQEVKIAEIHTIVQQRCVACHSANPTDDVFKVAPNGVKFDTPENITNLKDKILQRVVITKTMPQNNKTGMTDEERAMIKCWIEQGAKTE
jgi:uncharacterized membrane protein